MLTLTDMKLHKNTFIFHKTPFFNTNVMLLYSTAHVWELAHLIKPVTEYTPRHPDLLTCLEKLPDPPKVMIIPWYYRTWHFRKATKRPYCSL